MELISSANQRKRKRWRKVRLWARLVGVLSLAHARASSRACVSSLFCWANEEDSAARNPCGSGAEREDRGGA